MPSRLKLKFKNIIYHNDSQPGLDFNDDTSNTESDSNDDDNDYGQGHIADHDHDEPADADLCDPIDQSEIYERLADDTVPELVELTPVHLANAPVPPPAQAQGPKQLLFE